MPVDPKRVRGPSVRRCALAAAWLLCAGGARAQEAQGPIATQRSAPAAGKAAEPRAPPRGSVPEPDAFAWLRDAASPEATRWREEEARQAQRWLALDANYPALLREAAAAGADARQVQLAAGRLFVGRSAVDGAGVWRSRPLGAAPPRSAVERAEPALASPAGATPTVTCGPRPAGVCLVVRKAAPGLRLEGYDPATGAVRPSPSALPPETSSAVLDGAGSLLVVSRDGAASVVRRLPMAGGAAASPVLFRAEPGETVTPGAAIGPDGKAVSWLTVTGVDGVSTLRVEAEGEFRRLAAPAGSQIVGVVDGQLVVALGRGWEGVADLPPGALLGFDLAPLLERAPELTPRRVLKLVDTPDVRAAAATRSGLLLVVHEGAADVVYLCDPGLRGWAVRRLASPSAETLEIAAASWADDAVVLRSRAFPGGERDVRVDTRTGLAEPALPDRPLFPGRALQALEATAIDQARIGYTLVRGATAGRAKGRVLLLAYEDLSTIGRDLVARGLAQAGRVSVAGYRSSATVAAVDLVRHPSQWATAALIDAVTDPLRAPAEAREPWARPYAPARLPAGRASWRRLAAYDNLRPGARYAPTLLVSTPGAASVFASDGARFTARMNEAGGAALSVEAADDAGACALAVAFLLRLAG